jgi:DEAD/DEAH box helicase domain-containing protein
MDVRAFLEQVRAGSDYRGQIVHERFLPARPARFAPLDPPLPDVLADALRRQGIMRLYTHQAAAIGAVRAAQHVIVVTATASGKTLTYTLPVLEHVLADADVRALYVYPTKALAQDQADALGEFGVAGLRYGTYDGDTPQAARRELRDQARIILTNPDMLHVGILPQHTRWRDLFSRLRYVVLDDAHVYRGVFGSHVANVVRRLRRVCRLYGAEPVFILTSATIGNPREFAETLLGLPVRVIDDDGAPTGPKWFVLWNPPLIDDARARRRSTSSEATGLFSQLIRAGVRTIAFTPARKMTELIFRYARFDLDARAPELAPRISPYRAGYLPEERRAIERRLFHGDLLGVVSTSALELGIDVGGLDAALLVGYPGTIASTWQRAGRAGRGTEDALIVLLALEDALDQYLMRNPDYLFAREIERAVIDPQNPFILAAHLKCAAAEAPLWAKDEEVFGPRLAELARLLQERGDLQQRRDRWYWRRPGYPATEVAVRSASGDTFRIVDEPRGRVIGTVDRARAFEQVHPGAIYLHQGEPYLIRRLDLAAGLASAEGADADYYTLPRSDTQVEVRAELGRRPWGRTTACHGEVEVATQVFGFVRKRLFSDEVLGEEALDLPEERLQTKAVWVTIPQALEEEVRHEGLDLAGGIHAVEHAAIGLLPLFAMCDRWDLGGVSYPVYPDFGLATIFIYEGHPGGVGITDTGYALLDEWLGATLRAVETCPCEAGCPSCIQSPKCGNLNEPLDKRAAIVLLRGLLGQTAAASSMARPAEPRATRGRGAQAPAGEHTRGGRRGPRHRRHR